MTTKKNKSTTGRVAPDDLVAVGCKIPLWLKDRMKEIARKEDRVYQRLVRRACEEFVEKREKAVTA